MVTLVALWLAVAEVAPAAPPRIVTLEEALSAADSIPDVAIARAMERSAAAALRSVRAPAEPTLTIETRSVTAKESVALSVPFRWGGQKSAARSAAEAEQLSASSATVAARAQSRRLCRTAWYALAAAEDKLKAADERVARSERNSQAIADLLEVQRASRLDALRAAAEAALSVAAAASARGEVGAASAELRNLLGGSDDRLSAGTERPTPPPVGSLEVWRQRVRASSPDLAAAEATARAAEARVTQRAREKRGTTSLEAGADFNDPTQPGTDVSLGLGYTIPTRGRAALDAATADRDRAAAALELARRRLEADVDSAWSAVESAAARFEAVDGIARPTGEAAELTRIGYAEGKLDLFRLLVAERALADAEQDRAEAYRDWGAAYANLLRWAPQDNP